MPSVFSGGAWDTQKASVSIFTVFVQKKDAAFMTAPIFLVAVNTSFDHNKLLFLNFRLGLLLRNAEL